MQKVVGSNPISRFLGKPRYRGVFSGSVACAPTPPRAAPGLSLPVAPNTRRRRR